MHISVYLYIIAISIIVGLVRFRALSPSLIRWFIPFLVATLAVEITGLVMWTHRLNNNKMYNIFTSIEFIFYSLLFRSVIEDSSIKKIILSAIFVYPILFLINTAFIQNFSHFHTITYRIGSIMVVTWCYLYFRQLMLSEKYISLFRNPLFWISTGLLFFYTGFFFWMSADVLFFVNVPVDGTLWFILSDTLNALLYTCFLISFLCQIKITKKSLQ